jgi:hypothetical protein
VKLLLLMLLSLPCMADVSSANVALSTNNLAATYNTSYPQLALTGLVSVSHLLVFNEAATDICMNVSNASATSAPTAGNGQEICMLANSSITLNNLGIYSNVYLRSTSGTLSSGTIRITVW